VLARILFSLFLLCTLEVLSFFSFYSWVKELKAPWKGVIFGTYILLTIGVFAFFLSFRYLRSWNEIRELRAVVSVIVMAVVIAKILISAISLLDIAKRAFAFVASLFFSKSATPAIIGQAMSRSSFITKLALLAGGTASALLLSGISNRYNYRVRKLKLSMQQWKGALSGLRIIQISDIHSGSFTDQEAVRKGIQTILDLKPDIILFTGDLVNDKASEMKDYIDLFAELKAPLGVYSVLGNHDYGDYVPWPSARDKAINLKQLKQVHADMGWRLLLNEFVTIPYKGEEFTLIGVENISGSNKFHSYGNLTQALAGSEHHKHKILMSHDPSHWEAEVLEHPAHIDLTLSGHTHGMQFGIEIPGFRWSPIQYVYKQWAGIYQRNNRHLYVNRGFGFLGYPGRVGILPEITLIEIA
jgi:uncharacterized protein